MVNKNNFIYPVPSQPVTKHSYIPLVPKRRASMVLVASLLKKQFFLGIKKGEVSRRTGTHCIYNHTTCIHPLVIHVQSDSDVK